MSSIVWYYFLGIRYYLCTIYLFVYDCLFSVAIVRRWWVWESPGAQHSSLWVAASGRARQVPLDHIDPMRSLFLSSSHIDLHALILLPKPYTFRIWVYTWIVTLSHAVMSVVQVFHPLWCWVSLCLCESVVVVHPSRCELTVWGLKLWFEQWFEWWRWLIPSWRVVLEFAKDRVLGLDTPGQHMPPHVWYGMACLLTRNAIGCVSCSVEWGMASNFVTILCESPEPHGARGDVCAGNLSTTSRNHLLGKL
jgi:hypothetical protein